MEKFCTRKRPRPSSPPKPKALIDTGRSQLLSIPLPEDILVLMPVCVAEAKPLLKHQPEIRGGIQHRNVGFFSSQSSGYQYSGQVAESMPLPAALMELLDKANAFFNSDFNGILVNEYINGCDRISAHSDDMRNVSRLGVIALSYGTSRTFRVRDKLSGKVVGDFPTLSSHALHMRGAFQEEFKHEVPAQLKVKEPRLSFTFRHHRS